ncbi:MAG: hypothetical protein DHS20C17_36070 [Cyclobacteriaceae bacterium]|nr:MAG: hypothetical protein DHS20C17_36070 [Cyclobacteriaceae bacterium]
MSDVSPNFKINIGDNFLAYGDGGHRNTGTCQVGIKVANYTFTEIIESIHMQSLISVGAGKA